MMAASRYQFFSQTPPTLDTILCDVLQGPLIGYGVHCHFLSGRMIPDSLVLSACVCVCVCVCWERIYLCICLSVCPSIHPSIHLWVFFKGKYTTWQSWPYVIRESLVHNYSKTPALIHLKWLQSPTSCTDHASCECHICVRGPVWLAGITLG
jgi:hypothetical protein